MLKKRNGGNRGSLENIENHWFILLSPSLNHWKKLSPSPKTIEGFGKSPPVPFPCYRGGDREGDPFIQCPLPSSSFSIIGCTAFLRFLVFFVTLCCFRTRGWWYYPRHVFSWHFNIFFNNWINLMVSCCWQEDQLVLVYRMYPWGSNTKTFLLKI